MEYDDNKPATKGDLRIHTREDREFQERILDTLDTHANESSNKMAVINNDLKWLKVIGGFVAVSVVSLLTAVLSGVHF